MALSLEHKTVIISLQPPGQLRAWHRDPGGVCGFFAAHFGKDTKTSGTEVRAELQGQPLSEGQLCSVQGGSCCIWASLPFVDYEGDKEGRL